MIQDVEQFKNAVHECVSSVASRWAEEYTQEERLHHKMLLKDQHAASHHASYDLHYVGGENLFTRLPTTSVYAWSYNMLLPYVTEVLKIQENPELFAKQWSSLINNSKAGSIFDVIGKCKIVLEDKILEHDHVHHEFHHLLVVCQANFSFWSARYEDMNHKLILKNIQQLNKLKALQKNTLHSEEEFAQAIPIVLDPLIPLAQRMNQKLSDYVEKAVGLLPSDVSKPQSSFQPR